MNWAANYLVKQAFGRMVGGATDGALTPGMGPRIEMQGSSVSPQSMTGAQRSESPLTGYHSMSGGPGGPGGPGGLGGPGEAGAGWGTTAQGIGSDLFQYWAMSKMMGGGGSPAPTAAGRGAATRGAATAAASRGAASRGAAAAGGRQLASRGAQGAAGWGSRALGGAGKALSFGGKVLGRLAGPVGWAYTIGDIGATLGNQYLDSQEAATRQQMQQTSNAAVNTRNAEILSGKHDWRYTTPAQQQQLAATKARLRRGS